MTDKEFKRLKRPQLIEIIYQLQLEQQKLTEEKEVLQQKLDNWQSKIEDAGSIAEATVAVSDIFEVAQRTADKYLAEIYEKNAFMEEKCNKMLKDAQEESEKLIAEARQESFEIRQQAERETQAQWNEFDRKVTEMLKAHSELEGFLNRKS